MKLDILLVDFAMLALVFVPYFLFILIGRKEGSKLGKKFLEEAANHQLQIDEKESWNNNIIGLDKKSGRILFVQKRKTAIIAELINLREVRSCELMREVQTLRLEQKEQDILQKIDLHIRLRDGAHKNVNLYDCEETYIQDYELKNAEKWNSIIRSFISLRPTLTSAA